MLAAKAIIREAGLNEVFTGGLGSYSLALLVISHLQVSISPCFEPHTCEHQALGLT